MTANSATQSEIKCTQTLEPLTPVYSLSKYRTKCATAEGNFKPLLFTTFFSGKPSSALRRPPNYSDGVEQTLKSQPGTGRRLAGCFQDPLPVPSPCKTRCPGSPAVVLISQSAGQRSPPLASPNNLLSALAGGVKKAPLHLLLRCLNSARS